MRTGTKGRVRSQYVLHTSAANEAADADEVQDQEY
jgi:hypothetical protein